MFLIAVGRRDRAFWPSQVKRKQHTHVPLAQSCEGVDGGRSVGTLHKVALSTNTSPRRRPRTRCSRRFSCRCPAAARKLPPRRAAPPAATRAQLAPAVYGADDARARDAPAALVVVVGGLRRSASGTRLAAFRAAAAACAAAAPPLVAHYTPGRPSRPRPTAITALRCKSTPPGSTACV